MHILIADDTPEVIANFDKAIRKLGHRPILCKSLREACATIEDPSRDIDIAFIDNHFHDEDFGIDKIHEFQSEKPDMDIVVTTKRDVRPDLVADVVNLKVGFFKKQSDDPILLEAEISQRVNMRQAKEEAFRRRVIQLQKAAADGSEGVRRLIDLVIGRRHRLDIGIDSIQSTPQRIIVPRFERFQTIQVGETVEVTEQFEFDSSREWKASTMLELGLGIDESMKFFSSKLGIKIKSRIRNELSIGASETLKSTYRIGQKLTLTEEDARRNIRRREYYRGVDHSVYRIMLKSFCEHCRTSDRVELRVFVPSNLVEVSVAYDKQGFRVAGEDGREAYHQLFP